MSEILREIDEELRLDRMQALWQKHGNMLMTLLAIALLAAAGYSGFTYWKNQQRAATTQQFYTAIAEAEAGNYKAAAEIITAMERQDSLKALALLQGAAWVEDYGSPEEMSALYANVKQSGGDTALQALASLHHEYLGDVATERAGAFTLLAKEHAALLAWKQGDIAGAHQMLTALTEDSDAPSGLRSRAKEMADWLETQLEPDDIPVDAGERDALGESE